MDWIVHLMFLFAGALLGVVAMALAIAADDRR